MASQWSVLRQERLNQEPDITRIRELSEQSANGTYSSTQRSALDREAQALVTEYNRIIASTTFNDQRVFDTSTTTRIQHGFGVAESTELSPGQWISTATTTVGSGGTGAVAEVTDLTFSGGIWADLPATPGRFFNLHSPSTPYYVWFNTDGVSADPGFPATGIQVNVLGADSLAVRASKAALALSGTGVFTASSVGNTLTVTNVAPGSAADAANGTFLGNITVNVTTQGADATGGSAGSMSYSSTLSDIDLTTQDNALTALDTTESWLQRLGTASGLLGAAESRLQVVANVLGVRGDTLREAEARITDADIATETSDLTRNQILQQTASAVLAQANITPQIALSLIR